jgi:hypothetical protein
MPLALYLNPQSAKLGARLKAAELQNFSSFETPVTEGLL